MIAMPNEGFVAGIAVVALTSASAVGAGRIMEVVSAASAPRYAVVASGGLHRIPGDPVSIVESAGRSLRSRG